MLAWVILGIGLMPQSTLKSWSLRMCGYEVAGDATISPCLILRVNALHMAEHSHIGFLSVLRDLHEFRLGPHAYVGQWNWFSAARSLMDNGAPANFSMGAHSSLTSRHYLDCSGGVHVGDYTTVAGCRSTLITHGIDYHSSRQTWDSILIGDYCIIGSNTNICPGGRVADRSVIGMGSTIGRGASAPSSLSLSPRANIVRRDLDGAYFSRSRGVVDADPDGGRTHRKGGASGMSPEV